MATHASAHISETCVACRFPHVAHVVIFCVHMHTNVDFHDVRMFCAFYIEIPTRMCRAQCGDVCIRLHLWNVCVRVDLHVALTLWFFVCMCAWMLIFTIRWWCIFAHFTPRSPPMRTQSAVWRWMHPLTLLKRVCACRFACSAHIVIFLCACAVGICVRACAQAANFTHFQNSSGGTHVCEGSCALDVLLCERREIARRCEPIDDQHDSMIAWQHDRVIAWCNDGTWSHDQWKACILQVFKRTRRRRRTFEAPERIELALINESAFLERCVARFMCHREFAVLESVRECHGAFSRQWIPRRRRRRTIEALERMELALINKARSWSAM